MPTTAIAIVLVRSYAFNDLHMYALGVYKINITCIYVSALNWLAWTLPIHILYLKTATTLLHYYSFCVTSSVHSEENHLHYARLHRDQASCVWFTHMHALATNLEIFCCFDFRDSSKSSPTASKIFDFCTSYWRIMMSDSIYTFIFSITREQRFYVSILIFFLPFVWTQSLKLIETGNLN